jgi:nucleotide-binding universal stress UspA family protein
MSIAKILVPLTGSKKDPVSLDTAFALGKRLGAFVDAVFIYPDPAEVIPITDVSISQETVQAVVEAAEAGKKEAARSARESFSTAAARWDAKIIQNPERGATLTTTFREKMGHLRDILRQEAYLTDLVIFPNMVGKDPENTRQALIDVLHCGRPVLLCAQSAPKTVGRAVLIGWDGGDTAAHALLAATPILESADAVQFACVRPGTAEKHPLQDAKEYLSLHNVKTCETVIGDSKEAIAEKLLDTAAASGYDLLVCGGYGHSRTVETLFGGTTDYLLSHADVPVFLAH